MYLGLRNYKIKFYFFPCFFSTYWILHSSCLIIIVIILLVIISNSRICLKIIFWLYLRSLVSIITKIIQSFWSIKKRIIIFNLKIIAVWWACIILILFLIWAILEIALQDGSKFVWLILWKVCWVLRIWSLSILSFQVIITKVKHLNF